MLRYFTEIFAIKAEDWIGINESTCFVDYRNKLIQDGYIFRVGSVLYQDSKKHQLILGGILGAKEALQDARNSGGYSKIQSEIESCIRSERVIERFDYCDDYSYCEHRSWESILIVNSRIIGASSLVCGSCGGLIAAYRLNLSSDVLSTLWRWERQYDAIDNLSMACSEYEEWSDGELANIDSQVNRLGRHLAEEMSDDMGCDVNYLYNIVSEDGISACPKCGQPLSHDISGRKCCLDCHVVVQC